MKNLLLILLFLPLIGFGQCISGDCENGYGEFINDSDIIYKGEFKNRNCHGLGTMSFPSGDKYVGEHKKGKRSGQGTYTWVNGNKYVGEWKKNKRSGQGTMYYKTASELSNMPAGSRYDGQYVLNKKHGYGKATYADGTVEEGLWKKGDFIE